MLLRSDLAFVEEIHLDEIGVIGSEQHLEVVDGQTVPLVLVSEPVGVQSCCLHELVDEFLLHADGIVGPGGVDVPFEAVLLRVVLGHDVGIVEGFHSRHEFHAISSLAGRNESPEAIDTWSVAIGFQGDSPSVVEPKKSVSSCHLLVLLGSKRLEKDTIVGHDNKRISESLLSKDFSEDGHVVLSATEEVQSGFIAEAGCPNGEGIVHLVLLVGIVEDILHVGGPLVVPINGHFSSREENAVNLAEDIIELGVSVVVVERNHLCAGHLQILDIAGTDICLHGLRGLSEVLGVFSVDSNDWILGRESDSNDEESGQQEIGCLHHKEINNISHSQFHQQLQIQMLSIRKNDKSWAL